MRRIVSILFFLSLAVSAAAQEGWITTADSRKDYNGATMANGRLGVVTDDRPFTAREIVLAGVFDKEGYNGVSRVARGPVFLNMELTVDGKKVEDKDFTGWNQVFDMKKAQQEIQNLKERLTSNRSEQLPTNIRTVIRLLEEGKTDEEIAIALWRNRSGMSQAQVKALLWRGIEFPAEQSLKNGMKELFPSNT